MGNTIGVKLHTHHGQEVICEARSHVYNYELAMLAWFAGCVARPVAAEDGILRWEQIRREIRPLSPNRAPTGLVEIENTHNMAGGAVMPAEVLDEICDGAHELGLKVHLDGARIFHAATYLGIDVKDLCAKADTVMFCLSKGLCAPVGSMLVGAKEDIARARLYRKRLGGGMRQAGVLAAPGLIALEVMSKRLEEDHANARFLAAELNRTPGVRVTHQVQTNIVIFDVTGTGLAPAEFSRRLKERGVLINAIDERQLRLLTHHDAGRAACVRALAVLQEVARTGGA
jgi:threonine aldolase